MINHLTEKLPPAIFFMALAHLTVELCNNFMPVAYPLFIAKLGLSYTQVGLIAMIATVGASLSQPVFGYLSDRWGATRLAVLSIGWIGLLMGLVGFTWSYLSLMLLVGLGALGSAAFHPAGATLASRGGAGRRGAAMSVFSVSGNLGTALSPLLVTAGLGWFGLRGTLVVIPVGLLVSLFLYWQLGQVSKLKPVSSTEPRERPQSSRQNPIERSALLGLILVTIAVMGRSWFQVSLMTYLPEWMQSQGRSLAFGGQMLSVFMIAVSLGSLSGGTLSDYIGRWQVLALSLGLLGPVHWFFITVTGFWQIVLIGVAGVLVGASFPVGLVLAQETWPGRIGLASALVMGLGWAPGGFGASVTGFVADQFSLSTGLQTLILPPVVGLGCVLAYGVRERREQIRKEWPLEESRL